MDKTELNEPGMISDFAGTTAETFVWAYSANLFGDASQLLHVDSLQCLPDCQVHVVCRHSRLKELRNTQSWHLPDVHAFIIC